MAKKMDGIVTVTDHIAKRFIPLTNQVVVCHNYASLSEFKQILHSSTPKTNICYIGGISEIRGIIELIKAAESTEVLVELAGSFDSTKLKSIVVDHSHVVFHGFVNRDEIKEILSRSFAGIVTLHPEPNIINSIPIKMIEYMAAGVAVISSDFEEWKVIIEDNNAGLCVNPMDVESISNAISFLKKNPKTAIQMGKNGRKAFKNKYNWQKEEKKLIELYFKLLNDNLNI
jgi:glycosyltransferase involved in cell wall biosynthesis